MFHDICYGGLAEAQRRVVIVAGCVLYEEQCRADRQIGRIELRRLSGNQAVEHGLQVVVAVVFEPRRVEHCLYVWQWLYLFAAGLVVYDTKTLAGPVAYTVDTVDPAANGCRNGAAACLNHEVAAHIFLKADNAERRLLQVYLDETAQVHYYDGPVYQLQSVIFSGPHSASLYLEQLAVESRVDSPLNCRRLAEQRLQGTWCYHVLPA